jgi:hypothetical protein
MVAAWVASRWACAACTSSLDVGMVEVPGQWVYYRFWNPTMRSSGIPEIRRPGRLAPVDPVDSDDEPIDEDMHGLPIGTAPMDIPSGFVRFGTLAATLTPDADLFTGIFHGSAGAALLGLIRSQQTIIAAETTPTGRMQQFSRLIVGGLRRLRAVITPAAWFGAADVGEDVVGQVEAMVPVIQDVANAIEEHDIADIPAEVIERILAEIDARGLLLSTGTQRPGIFYSWSARKHFSLELLLHLQRVLIPEAYRILARGIAFRRRHAMLHLADIPDLDALRVRLATWFPHLANRRRYEHMQHLLAARQAEQLRAALQAAEVEAGPAPPGASGIATTAPRVGGYFEDRPRALQADTLEAWLRDLHAAQSTQGKLYTVAPHCALLSNAHCAPPMDGLTDLVLDHASAGMAAASAVGLCVSGCAVGVDARAQMPIVVVRKQPNARTYETTIYVPRVLSFDEACDRYVSVVVAWLAQMQHICVPDA